jgi:hypothetical protein
VPLTSQAADFFLGGEFHAPSSTSVTVQVPNATTLAEVSLYKLTVIDEEFHNTDVSISQIVSARGIEDFRAETRAIVFREGVTSITFRIRSENALAGARWILHFYT